MIARSARRGERGALDADHELADRQRAPPSSPISLTVGVEGGEDRKPVARRRAGARLPPTVPALRICGLPTVRAASASAGSKLRSGSASISAQVTPAPRVIVRCSGSGVHDESFGYTDEGDHRRLALRRRWPSLTSTIRSVPPASRVAPGLAFSPATASSRGLVGTSTVTAHDCTKRPPVLGIRVFAAPSVTHRRSVTKHSDGASTRTWGARCPVAPTPWLVSAASRDGRHA